jgi:hypothetical protein
MKFFHVCDFYAGTALGGLFHLQRFQARLHIHAQRIGLDVFKRFFFAFMMFGSVT